MSITSASYFCGKLSGVIIKDSWGQRKIYRLKPNTLSTQMEQLEHRLDQLLHGDIIGPTKTCRCSIITLFLLMADLVKATTSKVKTIKKERAVIKENDRVLRGVVRKYFSSYGYQEGGGNTHDKGK